jgi:hypothetical protein
MNSSWNKITIGTDPFTIGTDSFTRQAQRQAVLLSMPPKKRHAIAVAQRRNLKNLRLVVEPQVAHTDYF